MGPYIMPNAGLRLEHFVIYGSLLYVLIFQRQSLRRVIEDKQISSVIVLCLMIAFWILFVSLQNVGWTTPYDMLAGLENFTQPAALLMVLSVSSERVTPAKRIDLLRIGSEAMIAMLSLNSLLSMLSVFIDTWPFVQSFVVTAATEIQGQTTWEQAADMGRLTGIFNQPAEAGMSYSIGLVAWVLLATMQRNGIGIYRWLALLLLLFGGILTVSKTFLFGGIPIAFAYLLWTIIVRSDRNIHVSTIVGGLAMTMLGSALVLEFADSWVGVDLALRFFDFGSYADDGVLSVLTGERFGREESGVGMLFSTTWLESPILGFGVPMRNMGALDNGYIEFFYYGGIVALVMYILILWLILARAIEGIKYNPTFGRFLLAIWTLIIGGNIGAPVLTLNRASIFLWITVVLSIGILSRHTAVCKERITTNVA